MSSSPTATHPLPSYLNPERLGPWGIYLTQVDRVTPYLGPLSKWVETLKRPKRALVVDVPIQMDDGSIAHFEDYHVQHNTSRRSEEHTSELQSLYDLVCRLLLAKKKKLYLLMRS